jgi:hypothetical protein
MVPKMSSVIVPEDVLAPEPALPAQFHEIWHRTRFITSERALALSVMWQAIIDLRKFRFARRRRQQRLYMEAYLWVASNERSWPYSFVNLCEVLNLTPEATREQLLGEMAPQTGAAERDLSSEVEEAA